MPKADLFEYSKEALERFPTQAYLEWKRNRREDFKGWLTGHYCAHYPGHDRYVRAILRGSEKYQIDHLRNLHELLELDAAGFDTVDLWLVPSTEDGICDLSEFTERLEQQSADYMRILDAYTPDLKNGSGWLDLHGVKQLGKGLFVQDAEDQGEPDAFRRPRLTLMSGRPHQLRLAPPASGRLLIITEQKRAPGTGNGERSYNLFNHALGFEDHARVSAGEQIVGGSWRAKTVADPEEWSLLVAIWPDGLSPEPLRLEGLLDRAQGKLPAPRNGHEQHQHDDKKQKAKLLRATSVSDIRRAEALPQDSGAAFVLLTGNLPSLTELRRMRDHLRGCADLVSDGYVSKTYPAPNGRKEQARVVANAVALLFAAKGERMGCGKLPDSPNPSGPFGRAVVAALAVFEIDADWFRPAKEAAAQYDNTN